MTATNTKRPMPGQVNEAAILHVVEQMRRVSNHGDSVQLAWADKLEAALSQHGQKGIRADMEGLRDKLGATLGTMEQRMQELHGQQEEGAVMRARIGCDSETSWYVELVRGGHTVRTANVFETREKAEAYLAGINLWLDVGDSPAARARVPAYPLWKAIHAASAKAGHPCNVGLAQVIEALDAIAAPSADVK